MDDILQSRPVLGKPTLLAEERVATPEDAFAELVERQSRFVFQVAYAVLRNTHDAEDVVQDTFLKLMRTGAWREMRDERGFLARTAWRLAVDRRRTSRTASEAVGRPDAGQNPESSAIDANRLAVVQRMIDTLPEELRQPLALSAIEELGSREIGAVMGIPEGTVRTRLMRARTILKQKLLAGRSGHETR